MNVKVVINEENIITGFAIIGDLNDSTEIEITDEELILLQTKSCKYINGKIEEYIPTPKIVKPSNQDKLNVELIKQNAELKAEVEKQKALNSQVLSELAKLKGGN